MYMYSCATVVRIQCAIYVYIHCIMGKMCKTCIYVHGNYTVQCSVHAFVLRVIIVYFFAGRRHWSGWNCHVRLPRAPQTRRQI